MLQNCFTICTLLIILFPGCKEDDPPRRPIPDPDVAPEVTVPEETEPEEDTLSSSSLSVLFVGNSLTYFNNLPKVFQTIASEDQQEINTEMIAYGNFSIGDHLQRGEVETALKSGYYDYLVVQQGPSSLPSSRHLLISDGAKLKELCDQYGTKMAYFMVWPSVAYYYSFDAVIKNHEDAAEINETLLCPVGYYWKQQCDPAGNCDLYGPDGFHPSEKGTQLAAEIIYEVLSKDND